MISVYFLLIIGVLIRDLKDIEFYKKMRKFIFINIFIFVFVFIFVFIIIGVLGGSVGRWLSGYIKIMNKIGGVIIIIMGLNLIGLLNLNFVFLNKYSVDNIKIIFRYFIIFLIGLFFVIVCFYCIGLILYFMLIYIIIIKSVLVGMMIMFLFFLGFVILYLLVGYYFFYVINVIKRVKKF